MTRPPRPEPPEGWSELNRALWDERVPIHFDSEFYDLAGWLDGRDSLRPFELEELGDVAGRRLFHPQCHFGQDTLSWARHGASVTGLDFSEPAIDAARALAARSGITADFVCADVYDASAAVGGRTFDVVYTGLGAINWLDDIDRWASVMASVCRPGGTLYLAEFHPVVDMLSPTVHEDGVLPITLQQNYFGHFWFDGPDVSGTYADFGAETVHNSTWERVWTIGEVVTAIASAGFRIELLHEHDHSLYAMYPFLEARPDGTFHLPAGQPSMPMMYSIRAERTG
jgi:SAM-dependent methyltransferase